MTPPTDTELMMLMDGELDPAREREVRQFVLSNQRAQETLVMLQELSSGVQSWANDCSKGDSANVLDGVMARIGQEQQGSVHPIRPKKSKLVPLLGAASVAGAATLALAAGLTLWLIPKKSLPTPTTPFAAVTLAPTVEPTAVASLARTVVTDPALGVVVDAVDFGSQQGSVFYVSSDTGTTTAVVWMADDR